MLDAFEILTTSGIVLWRKQYAPVSPTVINSLVADVFIEDRKGAGGQAENAIPSYRKDKYTLKWTTAKDLGLMFVVGKSPRHALLPHRVCAASVIGLPVTTRCFDLRFLEMLRPCSPILSLC